jgi:preprotein translocase subunit YajC
MKNQNLIISVLIAVIFTATVFFAGVKYQQRQTISQRGQFANTLRQSLGPAAGASRNRFGAQIIGNIISADDKSITVKLADGSTKLVYFSSSVIIQKAAPGTQSDLIAGEKVAIFGSTNTAGLITAQNIELNPQFRGRDGTATP